ncbi:MAG: DUF4292 domain-containing protein [Bacteroidetes bacterium]|nr:MAG: DUF4292 domain-containing protein [Bacteroidota bacterium]
MGGGLGFAVHSLWFDRRLRTGNRRLFFCFVLCTLYFVLLTSCKSKKNLPAHPVVKCRLDYKSAKTLVSLLEKNQAVYSTLNGKIKASVEVDDKGTDFTVSLRMRKDSILWASISPALGIEVIRFVATKDTLKFIDRLHSNYFVGGYDTLSKMLNTEIDLDILQSLLVGNSVEFYMEDEKLRAGIDSCRYLLGTIRKRKLRKVIQKGKELKEPAQNIWLSDSVFKISRILFREFESNREFDARFQNFQYADMGEGQAKTVSIPFSIQFIVKANKTGSINLEYTRVSVNKPQTFPFSVPDGYTRIGKVKSNNQ